jgi:phosphinothricin acetyltransferase
MSNNKLFISNNQYLYFASKLKFQNERFFYVICNFVTLNNSKNNLLTAMKIIKCTPEYASQILDIFNDAILNSTALYDYKPWTMDTMKVWFETKAQHNFPVIGIVDDEGVLMGFGSYGQFRMRPAYKYTIENSLYVHRDHRGKGLGKILLNEIISHATSQNFHSIIAVIDASNEISLDLHRKAGFTQVGVFREVGYKFGRWLDAAFLQLNLETPEMPEEG